MKVYVQYGLKKLSRQEKKFTQGPMISKLEEGYSETRVASEIIINKSVFSHAWKNFKTPGKLQERWW